MHNYMTPVTHLEIVDVDTLDIPTPTNTEQCRPIGSCATETSSSTQKKRSAPKFQGETIHWQRTHHQAICAAIAPLSANA